MNSKVNLLINSMGGGGTERQVSYLYKHSLVKQINVLQNDCAYEIDSSDLFPLFDDSFKISSVGILKCLLLGPLRFSLRFKENEKVLSFLELSNFINLLSKFFKAHEAYVSVRISPSFYNKKKLGFLYVFLMKWLYPYATKVITNSEQCRLDLLELIGLEESKVVVIKNALDLKRILELNQEGQGLGSLKEGQDFVAIGRLSYQKNYPSMLRIFSSLQNSLPQSRLVIIGDGEDKASLVDYCQELGLKVSENKESLADVYFLGFQENPYQFLSKNSLFLMTSHYEGLPNVLLEAMACGAFVMASDCKTGPREILTGEDLREVLGESCILGENGLLLPAPNHPDKEKIWVKEILNIIQKKTLVEKVRAQALNSSSHYRIERIMNEWERTIL